MTGKSGELKPTAPGPNDIRHAQVIAKYEESKQKDPNLTEDEISKRIAAFINHNAEISKKNLRKTFHSLDDPLATKKGVDAEEATLASTTRQILRPRPNKTSRHHRASTAKN